MIQSQLPSALSALPELSEDWFGKRLAIFLDYDGTITQIVSRPDQASLSASMRTAIERLARTTMVAIVSGRDRADVESLVELDNVYYAGSHGFDIRGPGGLVREHEEGLRLAPVMDQAAKELQDVTQKFSAAWVERKRFAVAVHDRQVRDAQLPALEAAISEIAARHPELRMTGGKRVHELRPNIDWNKGRALHWLLETLDLTGPDVVPLFMGDDETDEDAFAAVADSGVGIRVGHDDAETKARYMLRDTDEVRRFLERLNGVLRRPM